MCAGLKPGSRRLWLNASPAFQNKLNSNLQYSEHPDSVTHLPKGCWDKRTNAVPTLPPHHVCEFKARFPQAVA